MFQCDANLYSESMQKTIEALNSLQSKTSDINTISNVSDSYLKKSEVENVCTDLKNIIDTLDGLVSDMYETAELVGVQVEDDNSLSELTLSSELLSSLGLNIDSDMSYEDIIEELEKVQEEELMNMFAELGLTDSEKANIERWIKEENAEAIMDTLAKMQAERELESKNKEKDEVDRRISSLQLILGIQTGSGIGLPTLVNYDAMYTEKQVKEAKEFLETNKDNKEAIKGMTFKIAGKEIKFHSYNEGMYYVEHYRQILSAELTKKEEKSGELKLEIRNLNKNISYLDNDIEFFDNFKKVYNVPKNENQDYLYITGIDINNCTVEEAFADLEVYYERNKDHEIVNMYSVVEEIRNNKRYKDLSDEEFYDILKNASNDFNKWALASSVLSKEEIGKASYEIDKNEYIYMTEEEKGALGRARIEGGIANGEHYLELLTTRSLNARLGTAKAYEMFEDIVNHPTKLGEICQTFGSGGWSGVINHFENIYGLVTDDYSMTANDWTMQTMQTLLITLGNSFQVVDQEKLEEFEKSYEIDSEKESILKEKIAKGEEIKYYELFGYVAEDKGGWSESELKNIEEMFSKVDGGAIHSFVLKSAYSAGISTGNMLPAVALNFVPEVGPYLSKVSFFLSTAGGTYREQRREGSSWLDSMYAAGVSGTLETGTEYLLGGIPGLSQGAETFNEFLKLPFTGKLLAIGKDILSEELEETLQGTVGEVIMSSVTGEEFNLDEVISQLPETWLSTLMSTAAMNSMTYGTQTAFTYGDTAITMSSNEWANLCKDGFNIKTIMDYLKAKSITNIDNRTNESIVQGLNKQLAKSGMAVNFEYENGVFKVNGQELTKNEADSLLHAGEENDQIDLSKLPEILTGVLAFTVKERTKLEEINPNWRNELTTEEIKKTLGKEIEKVGIEEVQETETQIFKEEQDSQANVETFDVKIDDKVDVEQTENKENITEQQEIVSQEKQDRKLEESIEELSASKVEQTETKIQNFETHVNEDSLETPMISENIESQTALEVPLNAENINQIMNNPNNIYYGHGTRTNDGSEAFSIMKNGLRCSHGAMYWTVNSLALGTNMNENTIQSLNNWNHVSAKNIVIVSLPTQFMFYSDKIILRESTFYYEPNEAIRQTENLSEGNYVMPEFILGYYDANTGEFHRNPNYYELLTLSEQEKVFDRVKKNLVNQIEKYSDIDTYRETCEAFGVDFSLTDEEVARYSNSSKNNNDTQVQPETLEIDTTSESESASQEETDWDNYFEDEDWGVEALETNTDEDKVDVQETENQEEVEENVKLIQKDEYFDYETDYYVVKKNFIEKISHLVKLRNLSNSLKSKLQNYLNTDSEFVELNVHDLYEILASMNTRFYWFLEECSKIYLEDKEFGTRYKELYDILTDYSKKTKGIRYNNLDNHRLAEDLLTSIYEKLFHEDTNNFLNGVVSNNVNEFLNYVIEFLEIENKMNRKNDILRAKEDLMSNLAVILSAEEYEEVARQFDEMINTIPIDLDKVMNFVVEKQKLIIEDWKSKVTNPDDFVPGQPFRFICHSTTSPEYKGDFTNRYVSTSLLTEEFYETYRSGFGFIFSPDDVTSAMPYDTNTLNSADSADELFFYTTVPTIYSMDKLLKAMRIQREENRQKQSDRKVYSELVIDGFNPTAIFCFTDGSLSYNQNYRNAKKLQAQFPNLKIIEIDLTLYDNFNYPKSSFAYLLRQLNDGIEIPEYQLDSYKPFFEEFMAMKKNGTYTEEDIKNLFNKYKYLVSDIRERDIFSGKLSKEEMQIAIKYNFRIALGYLLKGERTIIGSISNIEEYKENPILLELYPGLNIFIDMYRDGIITEGDFSNILENNNVTSFQDIVDITLKNVEIKKQELLKQLEELRKTKLSIESEINASKDKINSQIEEIQNQINANKSRIKEIDEILEKASTIVFNQYDYNFLKEREERLQSDIEKLEEFDRENQLLNDKIVRLKKEQEEIANKKKELERHWYKNRKQIQELTTKIKNISAEISRLESTINSNNDDISMQLLRGSVNREKLSLQKAIQEFEEKTGVKYEEYSEQLQKALKLTEFDFEHKNNDNLRTEQSNLRMQISNLELEIYRLQGEMNSYFFETENKNKANEIDRYIKSLEKRLADLENSSKYQVETLDDKTSVEQTEEVETLTETAEKAVSQEEDSKLEESIEELSIPKVEQDSQAKVETLDISEYKVFKSEEELPAHIFENKKYINIFGDLADGYSLSEIYQTSSETKRRDIDSFIKVLQENELDLDMALALYRYSIGSNIILGIKRGTASKKSIFENIKLESKEKFIQREISQEMIATIDNFVRNLDYSLPLYKNYELTKEFFMKQGLSNKQISSILTYVKNINSLYHVDYTIAKLDEILKNTTLQEPMVLYRAVNSSYLKQYLNPGESLTELVGKTISETGYLSTSPLYDKSLSGQSKLDLVYEIYTPDGTKGVDVTPFSGYEGAEIEYLLAPTNLYVFEVIPNVVDKMGNTKTICRCTTDKSLMEIMINSKQVSKVNDLETKTDDGAVDLEQIEEQKNLDEQLDSYKPTDEVLMRDKKAISDNVEKFVDTILSEYGDNIPQNVKDYLGSRNIEDIVHIDNTGTISLYVSDGEIYLPKNAYNVLSLVSKIPGFGKLKNHVTHNQDNMIINNNTFLNFISHVFLKGLTPQGYFAEIALHETLHLCGSDGDFALFEGLTEFKTREIAQKYGLETSCCGYPKETRIIYELQQLFGKDVMDKITFADGYSKKYQIIYDSLGETEAELFKNIFVEMQLQFEPYISKKYPGVFGILDKCYQYSKIDYSKVYDMINAYRESKGLLRVSFEESLQTKKVIDKIKSIFGNMQASNNTTNLSDEVMLNQLAEILNAVEDTDNTLDVNGVSNNDFDNKIMEEISSQLSQHDLPKLMELVNSLKSVSSKLVSTLEILHYCSNNYALVSDSQVFETLLNDLLASATDEDFLNALKSNKIDYYSDVEGILDLLSLEYKLKAFELGILKEDTIFKTILGFETNQLKIESLKYLKESRNIVDVINSISAEAIEETEKLRISALSYLKNDMDKVSIIKSLSSQNKVQETLALSDIEAQLNIIEAMTNEEKYEVFKNTNNETLKINILLRNVSLIDNDFLNTLPQVERELVIDTLLENLSDIMNTYIENGTIKYYQKFFNSLKEKILNILSTRRNYFETYSDLYDGFYGADQNATRKYVSFEILTNGFFDLDNNLEELRKYLLKKYSSNEYAEEVRLKNEKGINDLINKITSHNGNLDFSEYEMIIEYLAEYVNGDKKALQTIINQTFKRVEESEYNRLMDILKSYGITDTLEARKILDCLDTTGMCSYADIANIFFDYYKSNPKQFKTDFGYSMTTLINNNTRLNSSELLLEMYMYFNSNLFKDNDYFFEFDGEKFKLVEKFKNSETIDTSRQTYLSTIIDGIQANAINQFLKYKNIPIEFETTPYEYKGKMAKNKEEIITKIANSLEKGNVVSLGILSTSKTINFINNLGEMFQNTKIWSEGGGHAVFVTGLDSNYIYVSTWGYEAKIPIEDFVDNHFFINVSSLNHIA